jgi:hypothetical protein
MRNVYFLFKFGARKDIAMKYNMFTFQFILGILFLATENTHLKLLWLYEGWERQDVLLYMRETNLNKNCEWRARNKQSSTCKWTIRSHSMCGFRWGLDWRLDLLTLTYTTHKYSTTANLRNSQITTAPAKPFPACCAFTSHSQVIASYSGDSSASHAHVLSSQPPVQNSLTIDFVPCL